MTSSSRAVRAAGLASLLVTGVAHADDWTSHGLDPAHQRVSQERSGVAFRAGAWSSVLPAGTAIVSSPAVSDGVVVFGASDGAVRALRAVDGRLLWRFQTGDTVLASPAIHNGRVFVPSLDNKLYALRLADGSVAWRKDLGGITHASPTVLGDSVIVAGGFPQRKLFRIDTATGTTIWETAPDVMDQFANSSAVSDGTQVIVGAMHGHIHSFDLATGAWRWTYEAGGIVNLAAPVIVGGRAYVLPGGDSGRIHAIELATGQAAAGWPIDIPAPAADPAVAGTLLSREYAVSSLAAVSGRLLFDVRFDDFVDTNADAAPDQFLLREALMAVGLDGAQVVWQRSNGRALLTSYNDIPKNWLCPTPAMFQSASPGGGALVAAASTLTASLQVLDVATGTSRFTAADPGPSRVSPVVANGRLFIGTETGVLLAYLSSTNQPPAAPRLEGSTGRLVSAVAPVFRWSASLDPEADAVSYQLRVDHDGEVLESWETELVTGPGETSVRLTRALAPGTTYAIAVRARDARGAWSEWSAPQFVQAAATPGVTAGGAAQSSLVAALAAARPGSVISLGAGTFYLSESLRVPAGVTLQGAGPQRTILDGAGQATALSLEGSVDGQPTQVKGLTVAGANVGIAVRDTKNAQLRNVVVRDSVQAGIDVAAASSATLVNATLVANGIAVRSFGAITVKNSIVTENQTGFVADHTDAIVSRYDDVIGNGVASKGATAGKGDMIRDVAFVSLAKRDLHVLAAQASTDAGDPADDFSAEPQPNGGRVNLGAFGGTAEAELSAAPPTPTGVSLAGGGCAVAGDEGGGVLDAAPPGLEVALALATLALVLTLRGRGRRRRGGHRHQRARLAITLILSLGTVLASETAARANACVWNKSSSASWNSSGNWTSCGGTVPGSGDTVTFGSSMTGSCSVSVDIAVTSIAINSGYTGTVTMSSSRNVTTSAGFTQAAGTWVMGTGTVAVGGAFTQSAGMFTGNSGGITIGGNLALSGTATFTSTSGVLDVQGTFSETGSASFVHNSGRVILSSTATSNAFASNGETFNNLYINDSLAGYWKLDEATGTSAADGSGYGNTATLTNGPTWQTSSLASVNFNNPSAVNLDGTNDYVDVAGAATPTNTDFTACAWVKYKGLTGHQTAVSIDGSNISAFYLKKDSSGPFAFEMSSSDSTGATGYNAIGSTTPNTSSWYHICGTLGGSTATLYVNGSSEATATVSSHWNATGHTIIGAALWSGSRTDYSNGYVDDVRIYSRALTAAEINSLAIGNQPGAGVATQTLTGNPIIAGDLVIASGTLAAGTTSIQVAGNWWNYGGAFTAASTGLVTFNGSAATNVIRSAGQTFGAITVNGTGTWTLADRLEMNPASTLTMTAGALSLSSYTLRGGNIDKGGSAVTPSTGKVVLDGSASFTTDQGSFTDLRIEPVTATNLVGYWKLDTGQGVTARDFSSGGHDATLTNGPTWTDAGLPSAILFDDPAAVTLDGSNDYIDAGAAATASNAAFSACGWIQFNSTSGNETMVSIDGAHISGFYLKKDTSGPFQMAMRSTDNVSSTLYSVNSSANPTTGTWYHLCGTFNGATEKLYVNGSLQGSAAVSSTWNATGHTIIGAAQWGDARTDYVNGTIDDVRIYNVELSAAQVAALASGTYPTGLSGTPTYTLGASTTVTGVFALDSGTFDTGSGSYSMTANSGSNVATINSGTYVVDDRSQQFSGGLTVREDGTLTMATSGGTVKIGGGKTFIMDGTLNASSTGAIIKSTSGTAYAFKVGSSATATPTLNITGLQVQGTDTNGMYINAVAGSTTTFTRFDNIAFSVGTGTQLLQIYAPSLYLVSNGCTFDSGVASGTTTYNVTLRGDGSATETRAIFGDATCATNKTPCESADNDDDSGADGVGDTTATNAAVIQWVHSAMADTSGTIEGFPVAAFDWNTFTYYSTYVLYHDVNGGTADRVYVRDSDGNSKTGYATPYWDSPSGTTLIGAPRYDTVSSVHYVYVATTAGIVYRLIDNTTAKTLTQDSSWGGGSSYDCTCTIATPLTIDSTNIYWGGVKTSDSTNRIWTLGKGTRTLAGTVSVTAVITGAAPAAWIDSNNHSQLYLGSSAKFYKVDVTSQTLTTTNNSPTGTVNGRISIINSKVYGPDNAGTLWVLDPATFSTTLWSYHDNTNHGGCSSGSTCAITSSVYVDFVLNRAYYGDSDGHLYAAYNSSGTTGAQLTGFPYRPGSSSEVYGSAPLYLSGVLVAGTTTGNLYIIDVNGGSGPVLKQTYKFGTSTKVSGVAYDKTSAAYMVSTSDATNKDGKLIYIDAMTDPTPSSN